VEGGGYTGPGRGLVLERTVEVDVGVVEEQDPDVAAVVRVDHAGARVNEVLPRQAGAGRCGGRGAISE